MVMFIDDREPIYCPDCGGQPTIKPTMWGHAYYAECSVCGWAGGGINIEANPKSALEMWERKAKDV